MSYNDNQQNIQHLLNWLSRERLNMGEPFRFYSLEQVQQSKILPLLLCRLHPTFFSDFDDGQCNHKKYLLLIERYLLEIEDLRLKRTYKQLLLRRECISDVVRLILFLVMKHQMKQEFVARILELDESTQIQLMTELKTMQGKVENNMEIKDIFNKIEELQVENEGLNEKLKDLQIKCQTIKIGRRQAREQNERLVEQNRINIREKAEVMQSLGLHQIKDYLSFYRDLQNDRVEMIRLQKQVQQNNFRLQETNFEMQEKIAEDKLIVEHLGDQIGRYKGLLNQLKVEGRPSFQMRASKQNKQNKQNIQHRLSSARNSSAHKMTKSTEQGEQDTTACSFRNVTVIQEDDPIEYTLKDYNGQLVGKLQQAYAAIGVYNDQIAGLKQQNDLLVRKNRKKERKVALAEREFRQFCLNYQYTISG